MTDQLEQRLRAVFQEDAELAPAIGLVGPGVIRRVRRRQRLKYAAATGLSLAFVAAVVSGGTVLLAPKKTLQSAAAPHAAPQKNGALPDPGMTDCRLAESAADVAKLPASFDGTVSKIGLASDGADAISARYVGVTFTVNEWFRGGPGQIITVRMAAPLAPTEVVGDPGPSYGIGTRLLLSGAPDEELPGPEGISAWGCGYTRYYDEETAAAWRSAVNKN